MMVPLVVAVVFFVIARNAGAQVSDLPPPNDQAAPSAAQVPLDTLPDALPAVSSKDLEVELVPVQRGAPPGSAVRLRFSIVNLEETEERLRLNVVAGHGWRLADHELQQREWIVDTYDWIEGEFDLLVPDNAPVGDRQMIRLLVEVVGDPGAIEAQTYVSVTKRGGIRPGVPTVSGSATVGLSQLGVSGLHSAQRVRAVTFASKRGQSAFSFSYDQGLNENLSNFRYEEARTRLTGNLRHRGWIVNFGNYVAAPGNALTGPFVLGRGASVQRPTGRLLTELVVAQPNTIEGQAAGHLVRGRAGLRTPLFTVAIDVSDFSRPAGGYTTTSSVQTTILDPETKDELEFERRLTQNSASNRAQGLGVDTELRLARVHRLAIRSGGLRLSNAAGDRAGSLVTDASYALATPSATFNVRWRDTPPTVSGIYVPSDELGADGSLRLWRDLRVVGRAYRSSVTTVGRTTLSSRGDGASLGVRVVRRATRIEVRANYRDSQYSTMSTRRSISILASTPAGPLALSGNADVGEEDSGARPQHIALYRANLRWTGAAGTASFSASHSDTAGVRRQRFDALASLKLGATEFTGGAWATRGYDSGGRPGIWTSIGIPVGFESTLLVGADYSPVTWADAPSLRGMVSIRKGFTFPVPFARPAPPVGLPPRDPFDESPRPAAAK
jgi:hypothetical protein